MKTSAICINGEWKEVYKDPITDRVKRSKKGRLALIKQDGQFKTVTTDNIGDAENLLVTVFRDGQVIADYALDDIRQRADKETLFVA